MRSPLRFSIATRIRDRYIIDLLKPKKSDVILDLGCGIGYYCEFLSNLGVAVFGVDIDQKSIDMAKESYPTINFSVCSANGIPFKADSFDKVLCTEILEHIKDEDKAIKEIYRVTKPGGLILITVPCFEGIFGSLIKEIGHSRGCGFEKHFRRGYSIGTIKELTDRNGLKLLSYNYSMTLFTELYMGFTKLAFLLLEKSSFKGQLDLKSINEDSFKIKLNKLFLQLFLKIGIIEDKMLSKIIKGHMLILLCAKNKILYQAS